MLEAAAGLTVCLAGDRLDYDGSPGSRAAVRRSGAQNAEAQNTQNIRT